MEDVDTPAAAAGEPLSTIVLAASPVKYILVNQNFSHRCTKVNNLHSVAGFVGTATCRVLTSSKSKASDTTDGSMLASQHKVQQPFACHHSSFFEQEQ